MTLRETLKPLFHSGDRNRGSAYHRHGYVYSIEVNNGLLIAGVDGHESSYEVTIDVEDYGNTEALSCTCPRFADGSYCKHIWATVLAYDSVHGSRSDAGSDKRRKSKKKAAPKWKSLLERNTGDDLDWRFDSPSPFQSAASQQAEIHYVIDASDYSSDERTIGLNVLQRLKKVNGEWGKLKPFKLSHGSMDKLVNSTDRSIANYLMGADRKYTDPYSYRMAANSFSRFEVDPNWSAELCELLLKSDRLHWTPGINSPLEDFFPVKSIDLESPAELCVNVSEISKPKHGALLEVAITKNGTPLKSEDLVAIATNGIALTKNGLMTINNPAAIDFWVQVYNSPPIEIAKKDRKEFLQRLSCVRGLPHVSLPESWNVRQSETVSPIGVLRLNHAHRANELRGDLFFAYGETEFPLKSSGSTIYDADSNSWYERDANAESKLLQAITAFPIADTTREHYSDHDFRINKKHLVRIVDELGVDGWKIRLMGKPVKQAGELDISVESGQDWFDLLAKVSFDGESIPLPGLLRAIAKKEHFITLADGSQGRIPTELIEKHARLAKFGQVEDDKIRFQPTQAMLLDAMLDAQQVSVDIGFQSFRKKLRSFTGVKPKSPPRGFQGELRKYQTEGLGWLHFLREYQFGGCLADDMGLGKTIQVLSLLESRRTRRVAKTDSAPSGKRDSQNPAELTAKSAKKETDLLPAIVSATATLKRKPSIVIVPKSLIFNWIEEAAKFTPKLRILNYTGTARKANVEESEQSGGFDVLLTTYGTMRKDIADLSQVQFDYAILDESQAIKNSKAQCAKASRLLRADHRLAMTGTPIENHLGELWSLFDFLNPGMLGGSTNFARLTNQKKNNESEREETLGALSKAIAPFLLRRTKEQVLTDLPPKTEQTLYCDMLPAQKKVYNELKEYYRIKLAKKVETEGIGRSKIQVLEALLRLRQVACDPRLIDKKSKPGAKLELLQQQLGEVISEGHKVLVFSQFTSFLSLVKQQFDDEGINYEYLDGKSSNRAASVKRFQEDESVSAFLISIKAGGHGLNLTAADYVFLLDPWWNPAVEAQAIDRAHRMGQQNPVIAYRMICRDTVEEKIVSLQQSKRDLADKIVRSDESLIRSLTADDLQRLLE